MALSLSNLYYFLFKVEVFLYGSLALSLLYSCVQFGFKHIFYYMVKN
jgi:hypothetical protein